MHWTPGKCPQLRLQTCTAHFHSTQLDCLSHLTWLVKSYPSLLMGNMEGQKTKYNGPTHPGFFFFSFRAADIELRDDKTEQVEAAAREREAVQSRWSEGEKPAGLCMSRPGLGRWQSHTKGSEKPRNLKWPLQTISAVKKGRRGHPVMWNAPRQWLKGERMFSVSFSCSRMDQRWFLTLWKEFKF